MNPAKRPPETIPGERSEFFEEPARTKYFEPEDQIEVARRITEHFQNLEKYNQDRINYFRQHAELAKQFADSQNKVKSKNAVGWEKISNDADQVLVRALMLERAIKNGDIHGAPFLFREAHSF